MNYRILKPFGSAISMLISIALLAGGSLFCASLASAAEGKSKMLNANARMGSHYKHYRHHRHHKHIGLHKTHAKHIAVKHVTPAAKRS